MKPRKGGQRGGVSQKISNLREVWERGNLPGILLVGMRKVVLDECTACMHISLGPFFSTGWKKNSLSPTLSQWVITQLSGQISTAPTAWELHCFIWDGSDQNDSQRIFLLLLHPSPPGQEKGQLQSLFFQSLLLENRLHERSVSAHNQPELKTIGMKQKKARPEDEINRSTEW